MSANEFVPGSLAESITAAVIRRIQTDPTLAAALRAALDGTRDRLDVTGGTDAATPSARGLGGEITLDALAIQLGKFRSRRTKDGGLDRVPNTRAARDWCTSRGVRRRRDGKFNWVRVVDVERAIAAKRPTLRDDRDDAAERAALAMMNRR